MASSRNDMRAQLKHIVSKFSESVSRFEGIHLDDMDHQGARNRSPSPPLSDQYRHSPVRHRRRRSPSGRHGDRYEQPGSPQWCDQSSSHYQRHRGHPHYYRSPVRHSSRHRHHHSPQRSGRHYRSPSPRHAYMHSPDRSSSRHHRRNSPNQRKPSPVVPIATAEEDLSVRDWCRKFREEEQRKIEELNWQKLVSKGYEQQRLADQKVLDEEKRLKNLQIQAKNKLIELQMKRDQQERMERERREREELEKQEKTEKQLLFDQRRLEIRREAERIILAEQQKREQLELDRRKLEEELERQRKEELENQRLYLECLEAEKRKAAESSQQTPEEPEVEEHVAEVCKLEEPQVEEALCFEVVRIEQHCMPQEVLSELVPAEEVSISYLECEVATSAYVMTEPPVESQSVPLPIRQVEPRSESIQLKIFDQLGILIQNRAEPDFSFVFQFDMYPDLCLWQAAVFRISTDADCRTLGEMLFLLWNVKSRKKDLVT